MCAPKSNLQSLPLLPPGKQAFFGFFVADFALIEADFQKERVGLANLAAGLDFQNLHDLSAIELRTHGIQFLLLPQNRNSLLQIVVGVRESIGLALVAGSDISAGQSVKSQKLLIGIANIAPNRAIAPLLV